LEKLAEYKNGYSADNHTIRLFWEVFHDLTQADKKKFLLFLTGSDRIPILGMRAVKVTPYTLTLIPLMQNLENKADVGLFFLLNLLRLSSRRQLAEILTFL